jgi:hypothetical protein
MAVQIYCVHRLKAPLIRYVLAMTIPGELLERVLVQKFEPGNVFPFRLPTSALETALSRIKPVLYVRLSNDPFEDLI